jgi:trimeric autotransporter adhesin
MFSLSPPRRFTEAQFLALRRVKMRRLFPLALVLICASVASAQQLWVINTFAGGGPSNVPATNASIGAPVGVALDAAGNVYFSGYDLYNQVSEINGGNVIVLAGNGAEAAGQSLARDGEGGPATQATLFAPAALALDGAGEIFIPDSFNLIRKVGTNGIITTVAGSGATNSLGHCLFDGDGPALQHALCEPAQVLLDGQGNMFIADLGNRRIREVDTLGNMTTVAGDGALNVYGNCVFDGDGPATSHSLCDPYGIALDAKTGNLYIADAGTQLVRQVDSSGNMTTIAGNGTAGFSGDGGPATSAMLNQPVGLALDSAGDLYIADFANARVREVNTSGNISTVAGNGDCTYDGDGAAAQHNICPYYLALNGSGDFFFTDSSERVRMLDTTGNLTTIAGNGSDGQIDFGQPALEEPVNVPISVAVDPHGNVYANMANANSGIAPSGIVKVSEQGVISAVTAPGGGGAQLQIPPGTSQSTFAWTAAGIAVDAAGDVFSLGTTQVFETNSQGNTITFAGPPNASLMVTALPLPTAFANPPVSPSMPWGTYLSRIATIVASGKLIPPGT